MKDILDCCCGLDIHKDIIVACLLKGPVNMQPTSEIRTFTTLIHNIEELKNWLEGHMLPWKVRESTGSPFMKF